MSRKNQLELSFDAIEIYLDQLQVKSFSEKTLQDIFNNKKDEWQIPANKNASHFFSFLQKKGVLFMTSFNDEQNKIKIIYSWKTQDDFTVMAGLKNNSYYSYYTALFIHQLTLQIPKTYYLNYEHSSDMNPVSGKPSLTQSAIDKAFSGNQRKSSISYSYKDRKIIITNGKKTEKLGVIKQENAQQCFEYTSLERTLIDVAIRPVYAGGVFEVLEAYKKAKENLNTKRLTEYLKKMDYIYPYHQVIGFYLERAGYTENDLKLFDKEKEFDFYLTYDIRNKAYSERWKLYYPKGL